MKSEPICEQQKGVAHMFDIPNLITRGLYDTETPLVNRFDFSDPPLNEWKLYCNNDVWEAKTPIPSYVLSEFFLTVNADFGPGLLYAGLENRIKRFIDDHNPSEVLLYYRGRRLENAVKSVSRSIWDSRLNRTVPGKFLRGGFCLAGLIDEKIVGFSENMYALHPLEKT